MMTRRLDEGAGRLPPRPDFDAVLKAAGATAAQRERLFSLIGNLSFAWSNNEAMLVFVIMILLGTDMRSAAVVFGTLNTTRARLDLVQRLSRVKLSDPAVAARLDAILSRFERGTRLRNEFSHSMFGVDETGAITHTAAMKIEEKRGRIRFGAVRPLDEKRLSDAAETVAELHALNREIWDFLPVLDAAVPAGETGQRGPNQPSETP
jgi:hypothetical protein